MEKIYLQNDATFNEFPDRMLNLDSNSNLFYLCYKEKNYIVREFLKSVETFEKNNRPAVKIISEYYNVINGVSITTKYSWYYQEKLNNIYTIKNNDIIELLPLKWFFSIDEYPNKKCYLTKNAIHDLTKPKEKLKIKKK